MTFHSSLFGDAKEFSLFAARSGFVRKNSNNNMNNIRERSIKREKHKKRVLHARRTRFL